MVPVQMIERFRHSSLKERMRIRALVIDDVLTSDCTAKPKQHCKYVIMYPNETRVVYLESIFQRLLRT